MSSASHNIPTFLFHPKSLTHVWKAWKCGMAWQKNRILSHFSRIHEHFVIICLVLHFPDRGVEVGKVRLQDVRPKFGQISTPMSTTKKHKAQREHCRLWKMGHFDYECIYFVANLFNATFFHPLPETWPRNVSKDKISVSYLA